MDKEDIEKMGIQGGHIKRILNRIAEIKKIDSYENFPTKEDYTKFQKGLLESRAIFHSKVLKKGEPALLNSWLPESLKFKKLGLVWSATRHGDSKEEYMKRCLGKGNVFAFVKTKKGHRFGGFRSLEIGFEEGEWRKALTDSKAFMFSLTEKVKCE